LAVHWAAWWAVRSVVRSAAQLAALKAAKRAWTKVAPWAARMVALSVHPTADHWAGLRAVRSVAC